MPIFSPTVTTMRFQPTIVPRPERDRDGDLDPHRNEPGRAVELGAIQLQQVGVGLRERERAILAEPSNRLGGEIHVVADVLHRLLRAAAGASRTARPASDVLRELRQRRHDGRIRLPRAQVLADDARGDRRPSGQLPAGRAPAPT